VILWAGVLAVTQVQTNTTPNNKTVHKFQTHNTISNQLFQYQAQTNRISPKK
jgi:hypothetical protein